MDGFVALKNVKKIYQMGEVQIMAAAGIDFEIRPPYFEVSPTHKARTWLLDPRAPKVEPPALIARMFEKWKEVSPNA